jgi:hypothetical protein
VKEALDDLQSPERAARRLAERFRAVSRAASLVLGILPETDEGTEVVETRAKIETEFNGIVSLAGEELGDTVRKLETKVTKLEQDVEELDRKIPMLWFREKFDASHASSVAIADYATLLGRYSAELPVRLDRVQFLLTRVVSFFMPKGEATPQRRRELLAEALPPAGFVEPAQRDAGVAFFRDAARRVVRFLNLKELLDSGFFVDIRGYKLSLRQKILDPEIMAAVIELNEAVNDNLRRLAEADPLEAGEDLEKHIAEVDLRIKAIFAKMREDESKTQEIFDRWLSHQAKKRNQVYVPMFVPPGQLTERFDKRLIYVAVAVVLSLIMWWRWPEEAPLDPLPSADLHEISPVLLSGVVSPRGAPKYFVGQVDKARWALMSAEQRQKVADAFAGRLLSRHLAAGTVLMEDQVVMQVDHGKVVLVQ